MNLHNEIMNIPCDNCNTNPILALGYKEGHRDARHAAAELALKADEEIESLRAQLEAANKLIVAMREKAIEDSWRINPERMGQ